MGRSKAAQNKPANKNTVASTSSSSSANGKTYNALELLERAETILNDSGNIELAAQFAARARPACINDEDRMRCDEVEGMIAMENGQEDRAIEVRRIHIPLDRPS